MPASILTISTQTQRRFILGKQGLWPGRRWQGKTGAAQAIYAGVVVQVDPLNMIARSHDITLHSRVSGYCPEMLDELLYREHAFFDYGGVVRVQPMESLPYMRVVMARNADGRRHLFEQNREAAAEVLAALRERGPLSNRDFDAPRGEKQYWHAAKTTSQALYYLWLKGEVMTHSRRGFERRFDLAERIAPPQHNWTASVEEAEAYFACRALQELGLSDLRGWRTAFMNAIERKVSFQEAADRLDAMLSSGLAAQARLEDGEGKAKDPVRYLLAADLPLLEEVQSGRVPAAWQPAGPTTGDEAVFLAPLDIVSARGRALPVFGFEYKWEVYTPIPQRRWGYYVLPILYGDQLVARFDSRLDRKSRTLIVLGFWLEAGVLLEARLKGALAAAFRRFAAFTGAESIAWGPLKVLE